MKKFYFVLLFLLTLSLLFSEVISYNFEKPQIVSKNSFSELIYEESQNFGKEGEPLLPLMGANILLSQNQELESIKVISKTYYTAIENIKIKPASKQFPITQQAGNYQVIPDPKIYSSLHPYPEKIIGSSNTHYMNGHSIASYTICPIQYIPAQNNVKFLKELTIEIQTKTSSNYSELENFLKNSVNIKNKIVSIIDNPENISSYNYPILERDEEYDILLITNNALLPAFEDYIEFKESTGFYVVTETTENIYSNYAGQDEQEKIRNCIIDYYTNSGIGYVILGGDSSPNTTSDNIVPHRGFSVLDEDDLPSDMYYSNLDGNWNNDGDNNWGEYGEMDLYAELDIGRICVDSATEIQNFTNKLIMYQNEPMVDDIEKCLMIGEELNDYPQTNGGDYKDEIALGGTYNGYTTHGIANNFTISYLYERDMNWNKYDAFDQFNNTGINLMNHLGHSSTTYNMKMYNSDLTTTNFTNDGITRGFVIGYSQGCYNGSFDNWHFDGYYTEDCFAEKITTLETGEVACIANSRYGWYEPGGTNSSSQYYDRQFFDAIFGQNIFEIGAVNRYSHEIDVSYMENDEYMRWVAYQTTLFGDPSMDIWTAQPTDFENVIYPTVINIGIESVIIEVGIEGARIGITNEGELIGAGITDESGVIEIVFDELPIEPAEFDLSIIAHNKNRFEGTIEVIAGTGPFLTTADIQIDDTTGNDNGVIDHGETIDFLIGLHNYGSEEATNITASITSDNEFVSILNATTDYENILPDGTTVGLESFRIEVSQYCPDDEDIIFQLTINSNELEWEYNFSLTSFAPILSIDNYSIEDENENGCLEPGETVTLDICLINDGNGIADNISGWLYCDDEFLTMNDNSSQILTLTDEEFSFFETPFTFIVSDECPSIYSFTFNLILNEELGYYNLLQINLNVGFNDNIELGENGWTHYDQNGGNDQWHQTEYNSNSATHSWKVGGIGENEYENGLLCALETPEMEVNEDAYLTFYHWMQAEISSSYPGYCYDGGVVDIYYNDLWQTIEPEGGYSYLTRGDNNPPFAEDTEVYSGYINWEKAFFSLEGFTGTVKFRFVFGSDAGLSMEGWYIDDVAIIGADTILEPPSNLVGESNEPSGILLNWNSPEENPDSYNIYRRDDLFSPYSFLVETANTSYTDGNISAEIVYYYVVTAIYPEGESFFSNSVYASCETVGIEDSVPELHITKLHQNYPNPFNPSTSISFYLTPENTENTKLNIYNLKGQKVKTLINGKLNTGFHSYTWHGDDNSGRAVSSGIYFYELKTGNGKFTRAKKMILMK